MIRFFPLVMLSFSVLLPVLAKAKDRMIDTGKTKVQWYGSKTFIDQTHMGHIKVKQGKVTFKGDKPVSVQVVMDMTSITNKNLTDKEKNTKLVNHLKSPDFFGVKKFPEAELKVNKVEPKGQGLYQMSGTLTIKGTAKPISMTAVNKDGKLLVNMAFDRTHYNVRFGSGSFFDNLGDKTIDDTIKIKAEVHMK